MGALCKFRHESIASHDESGVFIKRCFTCGELGHLSKSCLRPGGGKHVVVGGKSGKGGKGKGSSTDAPAPKAKAKQLSKKAKQSALAAVIASKASAASGFRSTRQADILRRLGLL